MFPNTVLASGGCHSSNVLKPATAPGLLLWGVTPRQRRRADATYTRVGGPVFFGPLVYSALPYPRLVVAGFLRVGGVMNEDVASSVFHHRVS